MSGTLREIEAFAAVVLLLEALHRIRVFTDPRIRPGPALWLAGALLAGFAGYLAFPKSGAFIPWGAVLLVIQAARYRTGLLKPDAGLLDRSRYLLPVALAVFGATDEVVGLAFFVLFLARRNVRFVLLRLASSRLPTGIEVGDVDHIAPEPIRYRREGGMTIVEVVVAMMLLVTISSVIYLAAANRALRLRQVREAQSARETAVTVIETALADGYDELRARDGETFPVPGGPEPGRLFVREVEDGLLEVGVNVPRRGCAPIGIVTFRSRRAER